MSIDARFLNQRLEDLKEHMNGHFNFLHKALDEKCSKCQFVPEIKNKVENNWFHITKLWYCIVGLGSGIMFLGIVYYTHIGG